MTRRKDEPDVEPTLITIKEFAARIMVSINTARDMANSKIFCDAGLSVRCNPTIKTGGVRIHWPKYLEYVSGKPPVTEHRKSKSEVKKERKQQTKPKPA